MCTIADKKRAEYDKKSTSLRCQHKKNYISILFNYWFYHCEKRIETKFQCKSTIFFGDWKNNVKTIEILVNLE